MVDISPQNQSCNISVNSPQNQNNSIETTTNALTYYTNLAKRWATFTKDAVDGNDYSAKYYALKSKNNLQAINEIIENEEFQTVYQDLAGENTIGTCAQNIDTIQESVQNANTAIEQAEIAAQQATIAVNKVNELSNLDFQVYQSSKTYSKNQWVTTIMDEEKRIFQSQQDENIGHSLEDTDWWKEVKMGGSSGGSGLKLCQISIAPLGIDESKNEQRYCNGQLLIQEQFTAFVEELKNLIGWDDETKTAALLPNTVCSETEWQNIKSTSTYGQVGKFVIDDEAGTVRLPAIINIQGLINLQNSGIIIEAGLPNITSGTDWVNSTNGTLTNALNSSNGPTKDGCLVQDSLGGHGIESNKFTVHWSRIDASNSNSIYGNSDTVQPESIQYPYVICVNTSVEESTIPINNYTVNNPYAYGMSQYLSVTPDNTSWVKSAEQWNDGNVYNGIYEWIVENANTQKPNFKLSSESDITEYDWVLDSQNVQFRFPIKNGQEGMFSSSVPEGWGLYYYVGNTLQNLNLVNIARIEEKISDLNSPSRSLLVENYQNDSSWYRIYSDGWCEQGGSNLNTNQSTIVTITFLKEFLDTKYNLQVTTGQSASASGGYSIGIDLNNTRTTTSFQFRGSSATNTTSNSFIWYACGFIKGE